MDGRILNVLDEQGNVTGEATRHDVHQKGLLHGEVHLWFYTPDGQLIFQHRAKSKDAWPDLLDATVGGHVEIGDTNERTACKEAEEETGVHMSPDELVFLRTTITTYHDDVTGMVNHARRTAYAYRYAGKLEDLKIEEGKAVGFEAWAFDALKKLSQEEAARFAPSVLDETGMAVIKQIKSLV